MSETEKIRGPSRMTSRWQRTVWVNGKRKSYVSYQKPETPVNDVRWIRVPLRFIHERRQNA